jgi:capsular polysaccharide biosynthesis protein
MQQAIKTFLKKLLPLPLLRQVQLKVNSIKIQTVDKLLFPERIFSQEEFIIRRDDYPFRLIPIKSDHLDSRLQRHFAASDDFAQDEYLLIYPETCVIEPRYGWALSRDNRLIYPSLGFSRVPYLHKPHGRVKTMHDAPIDEHPVLISLRDTGEENYYHFYNDIIAKLFFLEEKLGVGKEVPVLIAEALYRRAYFQYFLQHPYLKDRTWVVQRADQYIRSRKTYFCKPLTHTPHYYKRVLELVQPQDLAFTGQERRIFITRHPKRLRFIENGAEAEQICRELGFEVLDFDELTLPEQIRIMANSRYVVGIHGAGLTNMLFRQGRPLGLLEIYPPSDYFPFHYVLMANQLSFAYDGLIAKPGTSKFSGGFYVDPVELRQRVEWLLTQ